MTALQCPKCAYVRAASDRNPEWQCPACGIAYAKYRPPAARAPLRERLAADGREMAAEAKSDGSALALVAANLLALGLGYAFGMTLADMMLVYWIQSVVIGASTFVRILKLERFDPGSFRINNRQIEETPQDKRSVAFFFLVHYGVFHGVYFMFIAADNKGEFAAPGSYLLLALVFALNHGYSLARNMKSDASGRPSIGTLMMLPYARIVPMHLTIIFGAELGGGSFAFFLFGLLKTGADVAMHTLEHHVLARPAGS